MVVAFPGTDKTNPQDLRADADGRLVPLRGYEHTNVRVHKGFQERYREARAALMEIIDRTKEALGGTLPDKIHVTGHSLGGAVG